jgi:AAA15 family ATPase/GTPase
MKRRTRQIPPALAVLAGGGVMAYDELDSDLHPLMMPTLLDLFANDETNPYHAQILFTTHQIDVLRLLQKSQVMIVEKDGLESQAWRLDELEDVSGDENRVARYMAGAYGGIPRL